MLKRLIVLLLFSMFATLALADYALKIIPLKHRSAEELIPVIRPMLTPGENVGGLNYQLFVRASDKGLRDIESLLAELDKPRRSLKIFLQQDVTRSGGSTGQGVSGEGRAGDVRIILPGKTAAGTGGLVIGGMQEDSLRYKITRSTGASQDNSSQFINVLEGAPAFIRVGQSLPYVQRFLVFAGNRILYGQDTQFLNVTTGFDVLSRLHGDRVELEIAPRLTCV
ncbi:MAG: secretin N-terminal domain-containing protein, partial [Sulfuricella sp.]